MPRLLERVLLVFGLTCLGWYGLAAVDAAYTEQEARVAIEHALDRAEATAPDRAEPPAELTMGSNLIGMLEIRRLGLSAPVVEGDDSKALKGAAGHLPDTPRPWEKGNSAIAAHRDTLFRPLRNIRIGDELRMQTPHGEMLYRVKDTHIVLPSDLSVLETTSKDMLTLITCYPFYYVGSAPKRFVVHAERVTPDSPTASATARPRGSVRQSPRRPARTAAAGRTRVVAAKGSSPSAASPRQPKATKSTRVGNPRPSAGKAARRR